MGKCSQITLFTGLETILALGSSAQTPRQLDQNCVVSVLNRTVQANAHGLAPELSLSLAASYRRGSLELRVSVVNISPRPVSIEIPGRNPPFNISIMNGNGQDLYQRMFGEITKHTYRNQTRWRSVFHS
jgi:hypothetical protein